MENWRKVNFFRAKETAKARPVGYAHPLSSTGMA